MKAVMLSLLVMSGLGAVADAAEGGATVTPQARRRLDPTTYAAVEMPAPSPSAELGGATMMDRFVVKEAGLLYLLRRPRAVDDPKGKFTLFGGGRISRREAGSARIEFGLWPHQDVLADYNAFAGPETTQRFDVVRVKW